MSRTRRRSRTNASRKGCRRPGVYRFRSGRRANAAVASASSQGGSVVKRLVVLVAMAISVLLAGCAGAGSGAPSGSGGPAGTGQPSAAPNASDPGGGASGDTSAQFGAYVALLDDSEIQHRRQVALFSPLSEAVSGIGTEASVVQAAPGLYEVWVTGTHGKLTVGAQAKATAIALATLAAGRS